jgi:hypothetical protein
MPVKLLQNVVLLIWTHIVPKKNISRDTDKPSYSSVTRPNIRQTKTIFQREKTKYQLGKDKPRYSMCLRIPFRQTQQRNLLFHDHCHPCHWKCVLNDNKHCRSTPPSRICFPPLNMVNITENNK